MYFIQSILQIFFPVIFFYFSTVTFFPVTFFPTSPLLLSFLLLFFLLLFFRDFFSCYFSYNHLFDTHQSNLDSFLSIKYLCKSGLEWIPIGPNIVKPTLVHVMAWCQQTTSHHLGRCWPRFLLMIFIMILFTWHYPGCKELKRFHWPLWSALPYIDLENLISESYKP